MCIEGFWKFCKASQAFFDVLGFFEAIWGVLIGPEFWKVPEGSDTFFDILECSEAFWCILMRVECFWQVSQES